MPHAIETPIAPMKSSGILDQYESFRVTPSMGTEFRNVSLRDWITGPDSDAHIRDLGILSKSEDDPVIKVTCANFCL